MYRILSISFVLCFFTQYSFAQFPYFGDWRVTGNVDGNTMTATNTIQAASFVFSASDMTLNVGEMRAADMGKALIVDVTNQTIYPQTIIITDIDNITNVDTSGAVQGQTLGLAADSIWRPTDIIATGGAGSATNTIIITGIVSPIGGIDQGEVVYYTGGSTAGYPDVSLAINNSVAARRPLGIAMQTRANGETIQIAVDGLIASVSTISCSTGNTLYVSSVSGQYTPTRPDSRNGESVQPIGIVNTVGSSGSIYVLPSLSAIDKLVDVSAMVVSPGNFLRADVIGGEIVWEATPFSLADSAVEYNIAGFLGGKPSTGAPILSIPFVNTISFPSALSGSLVVASTASTASVTFTIYINASGVDTEMGYINFPASATNAVISATSTNFVLGNLIKITAPNPQDDTLEDIGINLKGTRQ